MGHTSKQNIEHKIKFYYKKGKVVGLFLAFLWGQYGTVNYGIRTRFLDQILLF